VNNVTGALVAWSVFTIFLIMTAINCLVITFGNLKPAKNHHQLIPPEFTRSPTFFPFIAIFEYCVPEQSSKTGSLMPITVPLTIRLPPLVRLAPCVTRNKVKMSKKRRTKSSTVKVIAHSKVLSIVS
jgi:hypothetical protein